MEKSHLLLLRPETYAAPEVGVLETLQELYGFQGPWCGQRLRIKAYKSLPLWCVGTSDGSSQTGGPLPLPAAAGGSSSQFRFHNTDNRNSCYPLSCPWSIVSQSQRSMA